MKKILLTTAMLALAGTTVAHAEPRVFAQADLGMTSLRVHDNDDGDSYSLHKNAFSQRIAAGLDFQNGSRLALDVTRYGQLKDHDRDSDEDIQVYKQYHYDDIYEETVKSDVYGMGVTYTYAIPVNFALHPYVGGRLGFTNIRIKDEEKTIFGTSSETDSETRFSYGALAGVEYNITPSVTIGAGAEYSRLTSYLDSLSANGFLRYTF